MPLPAKPRPVLPFDLDGDADADETALPRSAGDELPGVEALLAGTLALMTGYGQAADPASRSGPAPSEIATREAMAAKIAQNLVALGQHGVLTPTFRSVLARLHERWSERAGDSAHHRAAALSPERCPPGPTTLQ